MDYSTKVFTAQATGDTSRIRGCSIPADLRVWADPPLIMRWVHEAVRELDWEHPLVVRYLADNPDLRPRALVSVLAYAYVTRTSGSEGVHSACQTEGELAELCQGKSPFPDEIISFRRTNRKLLERVLLSVYRRAVAARFAEARQLPFSDQDLIEFINNRLNIARHMDVTVE